MIDTIRKKHIKFIVVTGGVCSSIGKGVLVASIGVLLKKAGYSVAVVKWDPYLNVDPGTMSPLVHGEVFVTQDGAETDLDLGHYERLIGINVGRNSSVSSGQIYQEVLTAEREGKFLGKCIQLVPHVVNATKQRLLNFALDQEADFVLLEIGGTVGDIEGEVFLEAVRQLRIELGKPHLMHCHLSYVPLLSWTGEVKTKPTQHSVSELKKAGLVPDALFLRADCDLDGHVVDKVSMMCGIDKNFIFRVLTYDPLYRLFIELDQQQVCKRIQEYFGYTLQRTADLSDWKAFIAAIDKSTAPLRIGLIAKYVGSNDPYISVIDAIRSAGYAVGYKATVVVIEAEKLEQGGYDADTPTWKELKRLDGIVMPGGFDNRGIEGKIFAARWAREHNIPYFGLCLGLQVMLIEYARSVLQLKDANSTEFDDSIKYPVVNLTSQQQRVTHKGGTMRLGSFPCVIQKDTKAYQAYKQEMVWERHRHRYELNNDYRQAFEQAGVCFSGVYKDRDLIEIAELNDHTFMLGVQFHPEFQSSPLQIHPLFKAFMKAAIAGNRPSPIRGG